MAEPEFNLLPEDVQSTPDQDLAAAVAGALGASPQTIPVLEPAPIPLGRSWQFDYEQGRFIRAGGSPADTSGTGALAQWCLMAIHTARGAHPAFTDAFGMEEPDEPLGELVDGEILADWRRHLVEALLVHDRVSGVENIDLVWDPSTGLLTINSLDVITDEGSPLTLTDIEIGGV